MFGIGGFDGYDQEGTWDALSNALCNISSIESICNSNHTLVGDVGTMYSFLSFLGDEGTDEYTRSISPLLKLNKGTDKADVIRQKIFRYYLSEEGNLLEVLNMAMGVLPHLLEAIGKDDAQFNLIYRIVQGMPSLFYVKIKVAGGKRKREDLA